MRFIIRAGGLLLACSLAVLAQETTHTSQSIDLSTALRLAGAQNLDVEIARAKLAEAKANHQNAVAQFFPWIAPGIAYRQHDGAIQDVAGNIIDVHKQSYAPGASINAQVDIGDAYYKSLSTKKNAHAATHGLEAHRQDAVFEAVIVENIGEAGRNHAADTVIQQGPRGMFTGTTTPKIFLGQ